MKASIDLAPAGTVFDTVSRQLKRTASGASADFHLHFESPRALFAELTPARIELLDTLRRRGACSVRALSLAADRNYANVHRDVDALEVPGLLRRNNEGLVFVPFDAVEIHLRLTAVA